jgi:hypothetical protein
MAALGGVLPIRPSHDLRLCEGRPTEFCNRAQHLFAMTQRDADFFKV